MDLVTIILLCELKYFKKYFFNFFENVICVYFALIYIFIITI